MAPRFIKIHHCGIPLTDLTWRRRHRVSKATINVKLAQTKLALADKCDRLAKVAHSIPKQKTLNFQAARFRRQAADLTRK
jgi:hypothetical protein